MRIFKSEQSTSNYTGCVLHGTTNYAYFPTYKNELIRRFGTVNSYRLKNESSRAIALLVHSVNTFIIRDVIDYIRENDVTTKTLEDYSPTLKFYVNGELRLQFKFSILSSLHSYLKSASALIGGIIYILSNLTEHKNILFEYINVHNDTLLPTLYHSANVQIDYYGHSNITAGFSFDTPRNLKVMDNERIMLYSNVFYDRAKNSTTINIFMMSGRLTYDEHSIYLFTAEDNKVIAYEFNGITEFKFTGPREVTAIDAHDLTTL